MANGMDSMSNRRNRYRSPIPAWMAKREPSEPSRSTWWTKLSPVLGKSFWVLVVPVIILFFQNGMRLSEERLEKAKHISEISVDRPVSIVAELPAHLDAFILYAEQIRSHDFEKITPERLTELQARISSDLEGSRAYYSSDSKLEAWADKIKENVKAVRAKALIKESLETDDLEKLESTRHLVYSFHQRVIYLSVKKALDIRTPSPTLRQLLGG
jgi:hypothetical protein